MVTRTGPKQLAVTRDVAVRLAVVLRVPHARQSLTERVQTYILACVCACVCRTSKVNLCAPVCASRTVPVCGTVGWRCGCAHVCECSYASVRVRACVCVRRCFGGRVSSYLSVSTWVQLLVAFAALEAGCMPVLAQRRLALR
jgi:hypothetical protein